MNAPLRWIVRLLAWTAFGLSAYLTVTSLSHAKVVGCSGGETVDCESVLGSQWSTWLGLPVALGGLACYASLAGLSVLLGARNATVRRWVESLVLMLTLVAGGAGLWFIFLQLFVIHKICTFCMGVHTCGVSLAALVLWALVVRPATGRSRSRGSVGRQVLVFQAARPATPAQESQAIPGRGGAPVALAFGGAGVVLLLLVVGQVFFPPDTFSTVSNVELTQTIDLNAASEPAATGPAAADESSATASSAGDHSDAATPATRTPAADEKPAHNRDASDDLFASHEEPAGRDGPEDHVTATTDVPPAELPEKKVDQPASDKAAADLFAAVPDRAPAALPEAKVDRPASGPAAEDLFAAVPDKPPVDAVKAGAEQHTASRPEADAARLEPVIPVSAAGANQDATTADWQSVATGQPEATGEQPERVVSLLNGRLKLDLYKNPVLGPMDAPKVIVELMSYDCPHCRRMHSMIEQGLKRYEGQLAVVEMVVPLEMGCNKYITSSQYSHPGSCALTRLALGVATLDRTAFADYHAWLMADPDKPPSPAEATARAYQIVDEDQLRAVMQSDKLKRQIDGYVELYTVLRRLSERQHKPFGLPVQIVGKTVLSGDMADAGQLYWAWEKNLGLRPLSEASAAQAASNP